MRIKPTQSESSELINISSMLDVMFILIIFFLVTTTFKEEEIDHLVNLPVDVPLPMPGTGVRSRHRLVLAIPMTIQWIPMVMAPRLPVLQQVRCLPAPVTISAVWPTTQNYML